VGNLRRLSSFLTRIGCENVEYLDSRFVADQLDMRWILETHHFMEDLVILEEYIIMPDGYVGVHLVATRCLDQIIREPSHPASSLIGYMKTARQCAQCSSRAQGCACSIEQRIASRYGTSPSPDDWESFIGHFKDRAILRPNTFAVLWIGSFGQGHAMMSESSLSLERTLELRTSFMDTYTALPGSANTSRALPYSPNVEDRTDEDLTCVPCCRTFSRRSSLARHVTTVHGSVALGCEQCDARFTNSSNLLRHVRNVHQSTLPYFHCSICNELFTTKYNGNRHLRRKHEGLGQIELKCPKTTPSQTDPSAADELEGHRQGTDSGTEYEEASAERPDQ